MTKPIAISADRLFTGSEELKDHAVIVSDGKISTITPLRELPEGVALALHAPFAAPGFIDLQINGAADVLFNDSPSPEAIERIVWGARQGGTAHLLPTFITAPEGEYRRALAAVAESRRRGMSAVLGSHLEGPFLNAKRPGIHEPRFMRGISAADAAEILCHASGMTLVTLAPEIAEPGAIRRLAEGGAIVFAGHTAGTYDDYRRAQDEGLNGFTHLYNAMTPATGREPGAVGAAFDSSSAVATIIADGLHVHPANLRNAFRQLGPERAILITDAMPTLEGVNTFFTVAGRRIELADGMLRASDGTLAGAQLAMDEAVAFCVNRLGLPVADALHMAAFAPAAALGLAGELGRIAPGYRASMTFLNRELQAVAVMTDGTLHKRSR